MDEQETVLHGAQFLEPGFPVSVELTGGSGTVPFYLLAGDIDGVPGLELLYKFPSTFNWAWHHDGTVVSGWPNSDSPLHGKLLLAQLDSHPGLEVVVAHEGTGVFGQECRLVAYHGDGSILPGWPVMCGLSTGTAPVAVDLDLDGYDEVVFIDRQGVKVVDHAGQITDWTPALPPLWNNFCFLAAGDFDQDNLAEVVSVSCRYHEPNDSVSEYMLIHVYESDGSVRPGFPVRVPAGLPTAPVVGDVDNDGQYEIVVAGWATRDEYNSNGTQSSLKVIGLDGSLKGRIDFQRSTGRTNYGQLALADVDGDGDAEIIFNVTSQLYACNLDGSLAPGWPISIGLSWAIGDVDNDGEADVVSMHDYPTNFYNDNRNVLDVYSLTGLRKNIDVIVDYMGHDPAEEAPVIADIDGDGRNELMLVGSYWEGASGEFPRVWAFDFGGTTAGPILWGQLYHDEKNSGFYPR